MCVNRLHLRFLTIAFAGYVSLNWLASELPIEKIHLRRFNICCFKSTPRFCNTS